MSAFKYFAPPEWDNDVPKTAFGENLTKKNKVKKAKSKEEKNKASEENGLNVENSVEHFKTKSIKRKSESFKLHSKKKKSDNVESYIKFESPKFDETFEKNINETPCVTPMSKNKRKKKEKQLNKLLSQNQDSQSISMGNDKNMVVTQTLEAIDSPNTPNTSEVSKKTLRNRKKRKGKKNKNKSIPVSTVENAEEKKSVPNGNKSTDQSTEMQTNKHTKNDHPSDASKISSVENNQNHKNQKNKLKLTLSNMKFKNKSLKQKNKLKEILKNSLTSSVNKDDSVDHQLKTENSEILASMNKEIEKEQPERPKSLRERMMERLKGARFRYLNEQIYKRESNEASKLFRDDPDAFQAYHEGYRQQINKWPLNPLDVIIADISKLSKNYVIADLGCGDARLAQSVSQKVHSFDLVSLNPNVTACDMSHTPLLTGQVDVAVYCLSLMGTNLKDYLIEANRILKIGGLLKIAEVESRFENIDQFTSDVQKYGFSLKRKDLNNDLFYFMDFKKESDIKKRNKCPPLTLNPCIYKKR